MDGLGRGPGRGDRRRGPFVWAALVSSRLPPFLAPYLDDHTGSTFPVFPYAAFVLAGTVAGAAPRPTGAAGAASPGRRLRARRCWAWAPLLRLAPRGPRGLLEHLARLRVRAPRRAAAALAARRGAARAAGMPGNRALALLGRETLLVFVLHLYLLFGGIVGTAPLGRFVGRLGFAGGARPRSWLMVRPPRRRPGSGVPRSTAPPTRRRSRSRS